MANYYKQCDCGKFSGADPCYDCIKKENLKLKATIELIKHCIYKELPDENCKDWLKGQLSLSIDYALKGGE